MKFKCDIYPPIILYANVHQSKLCAKSPAIQAFRRMSHKPATGHSPYAMQPASSQGPATQHPSHLLSPPSIASQYQI